MNMFLKLGLLLFLSLLIPCHSLAAEKEAAGAGQVFDLGDVLVMDKGDEVNPITTTDVISLDDIKNYGAKTVADALEMTPGIDVQTGMKGQSSLKLRGFDQRDVKVLIDGVPAHEAYDGSLDLGQIPIDSVAKIKIVKGASSVLYGPNTMGGVINIITKKGSEKPFTSITTSFGENSTQNYILNHGAAKGKFNYWISGSHRTSDGFDVSDRFDPANPRTGTGTEYNEDGGTRDLSHYTYNTFNSKLGYEYDDNSKIYLAFDYHENEKGCPTESDRYWEFSEWLQWQTAIAAEHDFTDILSMKARVYYVDHDDTLEDVSWDAAHTTSRKWFEKSTYDDYTMGGELQAYLDFGDISLLKLGATYMKDNHTQRDYYDATTRSVVMFGDPIGWQPEEEYEIDVYSFGIEDEIRFLERFTFTAGMSYDVHDPVKNYDNVPRDSESTWNPQAGIAFDATEALNLYASVGKKTRFPQMKELYSDLAGGNSSLKPQKTIAYEVGAKQKIGTAADISLAFFMNDIEDRIGRDINGDYTNIAETDSKGMEAQLNLMTPWNLDIGLSYTYMNSEDKASPTSQTVDSDNVPEHKAVIDLLYALNFGLTTSFQCVYTGEQYDEDATVKLDDFLVFNAKLNQNIKIYKNIRTDLFVEIKNIFDENYDEGFGPTPGRSILGGMTFSF